MSIGPLKTLKEVAEKTRRPPHRIIHLCETGVVIPEVDADGRGSVRRFNRENLFRIRLALDLQDAGVDVPMIKPLMAALDRLLKTPEVFEKIRFTGFFDLVTVINLIGSEKHPVLAWLTPPDRIAIVAPKVDVSSHPDSGVDLYRSVNDLIGRGVSIVANLSSTAAGL